MVHSMNPMRAERQTEFPTHTPTGPFDNKPWFSEYLRDYKSAVQAAGGWDRDEWFRRYPTGIMPWIFRVEVWRLSLFDRESREYLDESDAFAKRFGGQASQFLAGEYGYGPFD